MRTIFTLLLICYFGLTNAQNYFTTSILNPDVDFHSLTETTEKDLLLVGSRYSKDLFLMKLSSSGELIWSKGIGNAQFSESGDHIITCKDGNFVLIGCLVNYTTFQRKVLLTKIDGEGNILWSKVYDNYSYIAMPINVEEDENGNFLICGDVEKPEYKNLLSVYVKGYILTNCNGEVIKTYEYDAYKKYFIDLMCSISTKDGGQIIAGTDMTLIGTPGVSPNGELYSDSLIVIKENSNGSLEWRKNLGKSSDYWASMVKGNNDTYLIKLGSSTIISIDDKGKILFNRKFDFEHLYMSDLVATTDGGSMCYGYISKQIEGKIFYQEDYVLYKFDSDGKLSWKQTFGDPVFDDGLYVLNEVSGGYVAISRTITEGVDTSYLTINKFDYYGSITGIQQHRDKQLDASNIKITHNKIMILSDIKTNTFFDIVNITGQTLYTGKLNADNTIQLPVMKEGMYILKLYNAGKQSAAKFIYRK